MHTNLCIASLAFIPCNWELLCNIDLILILQFLVPRTQQYNKLNFQKCAIMSGFRKSGHNYVFYMAQSYYNSLNPNPPGHTWSSNKKYLRPVIARCVKEHSINIGIKIYDTCRKKLSKESLDAIESAPLNLIHLVLLARKQQNLILCSVMVQKQFLHLMCAQQKLVIHPFLRVEPRLWAESKQGHLLMMELR